jgi:RHS repeat-associated protein
VGYTLPGWLDEILDFIGINFPNVDEDDYREMAEAMRDFAEKFEGHGGDAHKAVTQILASSEGWAVDAMEAHWGKVKAGHLDQVPELARLFADACDVVADIIFGMKRKAEAELAIMAGSLGISLGLAVVTGGLSAVIGAAEIAAMRQLIKRIVDEAVDQIVEELVARVTEPVNAKLEKMVEDAVLDLAEGAFTLPPATGDGSGGGTGGGHGHGGVMQLASAGGGDGGGSGGGPGGGKKTRIDHLEFEDGARKTSLHGGDLNLNSATPLGRAKSAFGRTKGKDPFTAAFDSVLHGALDGSEKALKKISKHIAETIPERVKATSRLHKHNDLGIGDKIRGIDGGKGGDGAGQGGHTRLNSGVRNLPGSMKDALGKAREKAIALTQRRCKTDPVDVASGEMVLSQTDLALPGVLPLVLRRTHISGYRYGHCFGVSWASSLDERLELTGSGAIWAREDGSLLVYARLPREEGEEVLPLEGERIALTYVERSALGDITYATTDVRSGLTRRFTGNPYTSGSLYWLHEIEDRNGNALQFARDDEGLPSAVVHEGGYRVRVSRDADLGRVTALDVQTPDGPVRVASFGYDSARDLAAVSGARDVPLRFTYDDEHRVTSWTDRNGHTYSYVYDAAGRVVETIGPDGALSSRFAYDPATRETRFTDSTGAVTVTLFNHLGQTVSETDPLGNTVHFEWDRHDNLLSRTDELGHTSRFTYDDAGNLAAVHYPDGRQASTTYNALHLPESMTGPDGSVWRQTFDERGNRTGIVAPDGTSATFTYDAAGALATATYPTGDTETRVNDPAGLTLSVTDPHGATYAVRRDAFGRPYESVDPAGSVTRLEWTADGWLTRSTAPDGATETWTYDEEGNCLTYTDPLGGVARFEYTWFDLLAARTGKDGARYEFAYDTELRITAVLDPQGRTWNYRYGPSGLTTSQTDFDGRTTTSEYDAAARLVARTTPLGQRITMDYDVVGNLLAKNADGVVTRYTYDAADRLVEALSPTSSLVLERDATGRLVAETVDGRTMRFGYDPHGVLVSRATPTGAVTSYAYDTAGNRVRVENSGHALGFARDELGRELRRTFGPEHAPVTLSSQWDSIGRLTGQSVSTTRGTVRSRGYTYRADGFLTGMTDRLAGLDWQFDLDPLGRPLGVSAGDWSERYTYDSAGNQTDAQWPDRARHTESRGERSYEGTRLVGAGGVRYEYDAAGRIVLRQKRRLSRKPDTWHYTWDAEDRLESCTTPDGTVWRYTYDALGRRTAKHRMAADGVTVASTVRFSWDATRLAEETDTSSGVTLTWDYEGYRPVSQLERRLTQDSPQSEVDSRFFAIVTDLIGTPTELVDEQGEIAWYKRATVWGLTAWNREADAYTPLRFPGQYADQETGLHYNVHRHYDPETARYVSADPLGLVPAPNPTAYVANPYTLMDPEGLISKGCTANGGWYGGLLPANLKDKVTKKPVYPVPMEVNHIPPKAAWRDVTDPGFYRAGKPHDEQEVRRGPAIRMERDDHQQLYSTGFSHETQAWHQWQRDLISQGRITEAMRMDIDDIKTRFPGKYDQHIEEMVNSLQHNRPLQRMLANHGWSIDTAALLK